MEHSEDTCFKDEYVATNCGYCCFDKDFEPFPVIYNLYVYRQFRKLGNGTILLKLAIYTLRNIYGYKGTIGIEASPSENSIPKAKLICVYERLGLKVINK
jgi:GNAT superfamily N-acetyltransferase